MGVRDSYRFCLKGLLFGGFDLGVRNGAGRKRDIQPSIWACIYCPVSTALCVDQAPSEGNRGGEGSIFTVKTMFRYLVAMHQGWLGGDLEVTEG